MVEHFLRPQLRQELGVSHGLGEHWVGVLEGCHLLVFAEQRNTQQCMMSGRNMSSMQGSIDAI